MRDSAQSVSFLSPPTLGYMGDFGQPGTTVNKPGFILKVSCIYSYFIHMLLVEWL